jgi:hypothetical protein
MLLAIADDINSDGHVLDTFYELDDGHGAAPTALTPGYS